jgi:hypothetical protein
MFSDMEEEDKKRWCGSGLIEATCGYDLRVNKRK